MNHIPLSIDLMNALHNHQFQLILPRSSDFDNVWCLSFILASSIVYSDNISCYISEDITQFICFFLLAGNVWCIGLVLCLLDPIGILPFFSFPSLIFSKFYCWSITIQLDAGMSPVLRASLTGCLHVTSTPSKFDWMPVYVAGALSMFDLIPVPVQ